MSTVRVYSFDNSKFPMTRKLLFWEYRMSVF